jgi:putative ABC transport system permease protein
MQGGAPGVCGGDHRIALTAMLGEVSRYWRTTAWLAATFAGGAGLAAPVLLLHGRLVPPPVDGGDLGLVWHAGVQPVAATQQQAVDDLSTLLLGVALGTIGVAAITLLSLSLARESERGSELAVRRAVGAGRSMLLRSAVAEAAFIVLAGFTLGAVVGIGAVAWSSGWPGTLRPPKPGPLGAAVLALAIVVLLGVLVPVILPRRRIGVAEPGSPAPLTPAALQVAATLVALTTGSLLARHAGGPGEPGGHPSPEGRVATLESAGLSPAARAAGYSALLRGFESEGAGPASLTSPGALLGLGPVSMVTTDCGRCSEGGLPLRWRVKAATHQFVSADTFEMMGVRVLKGRGITDQDDREAPRVAVVNRSLAAREFQDGEAIGRLIRVVDDGSQWSTVVGVVDDPPAAGLGASLLPPYTVYLSVLQHPPARVELLASGGPIPAGARPVRELLAAQAAPLRWFADRFAGQGWAMLGLAVMSSLAVARLWVTSLLVQFGVQRALGARRRRIILFVLTRAVGVCGTGIVAGVWFGAAVWSVLHSLVGGLEAWDPAAVLRFGAVLLAGTLAGALPPAWRAARATPASLLAAP